MEQTTKKISEIFKEILRRVVLPQVIVTILLVLLHWILITVWLAVNFDDYEPLHLIIISLLGGSLPIWAYGIWAFRKFVIKSYRILHDGLVRFWLKEFCDNIAKNIVQKRDLITPDDSSAEIIAHFKEWITAKSDNLPSILKRLIRYTLRKMGYTENLKQRILTAKSGNVDEISDLINEELSDRLIAASNEVIPGWIVYLIPINTILFIALWFL